MYWCIFQCPGYFAIPIVIQYLSIPCNILHHKHCTGMRRMSGMLLLSMILLSRQQMMSLRLSTIFMLIFILKQQSLYTSEVWLWVPGNRRTCISCEPVIGGFESYLSSTVPNQVMLNQVGYAENYCGIVLMLEPGSWSCWTRY